MLALAGWRFEGSLPDVPRVVFAVAPHTSNWDFPLGVLAMLALGLRIRWLAKHTLFRPPFGGVLRSLGGIPVRRGERLGAVDDAVAAFAAEPQMILALAPEGTRKSVATWKTGYYAIAERAEVPIVPVAFDWGRRVVAFGPAVPATGGAERVTRQLQAGYAPSMARVAGGYWTGA